MAQAPLRRLVRAESQGPADPVQRPRPSRAPASGLRLGPRVAQVPRSASPFTGRAPPPQGMLGRDPTALPGPEPGCSEPGPARRPALTSLRPQVPGTQLVAAPARAWAVAPGGGAPALRLFPTCARAGGGAWRWGAGPARPRSVPDASVLLCCSRLALPFRGRPSGVPAWAEPYFPPELVSSGRRPLLPRQSV